ncbi:hypothetical protein D3P07_24215 [Paenibacillus sp. 1011MAR3C5]|nr:hypothetical protein D3P07_24215 [Paenibacillus sp. 1011MAR3C5]
MIFIVFAWALVACIALQTFIAGMAVFDDAEHWRQHVIFVHLFEFIPLLMLLFAFPAQLPKRFKWMSLTLFLLIYLQYFTANMPAAGAFHPVMALVLIVLALHVARLAQAFRKKAS